MKKYIILSFLVVFGLMSQAANLNKQTRNTGSFTSIHNGTSIDIVVEQTGKYSVEVEAPEKYMDQIFTEVENDQLRIYTRGSIYYSGDITIHIQVKDLNKVSLGGSGDFKNVGTLTSPNFNFRVSGSGDLYLNLNSKVVVGGLSGSGDVKVEGITESFEVSQSGSGDLYASNLHLLNAQVRMSGSGDSKFSGSSDTFELIQTASGDFLGKDFEVETAKIRKSSSGDARLEITKSVDVRISGSGDFYYSGSPQFDNLTVTGSGEIVKIK